VAYATFYAAVLFAGYFLRDREFISFVAIKHFNLSEQALKLGLERVSKDYW
jgi:hypothetical protein